MSKGLISYTVQNIEGTPKPSRASVRMKSIHPSAHTQAVMAGLIHLPTWQKVHTKPYLASMATLAGKAMHGTATLCPYQVMGTGSHTQIAMSIRANMEIVEKGKTTKLKEEFLGRIYPLNPYTRQGCPCCPSNKSDVCRQFVIANARHYTMGRCAGSAKNMIIDYGNKIAAWIVSQVCPGMWTPHSIHIPNARKHTWTPNRTPETGKKNKTPHPLTPQIAHIALHETQPKAPPRPPPPRSSHPKFGRHAPIGH
jgi:hypothetical protein